MPNGFGAAEVPQVVNGVVPAPGPPPIEGSALPAFAPVPQVPLAPPLVEQVVAGPRVAEPGTGTAGAGTAAPARWGARGRLNRLSGGLVKIRPKPEELRFREAQLRVLHPFRASQQVMVANPKGGAGKTPTTLGLAATLGHYRGGYVLAWDNNETRGTLGQRAEAGPSTGASVVDLLGQIDDFLSASASVGQLAAFVRPQSAHFDVLASDETPGRQQMIEGPGFRKLYQALARWYRIMVVDTGNNVRAPNWWASMRSTNCLVVPTTVQADAANAGLWMLDHLWAVGGQALVQRGVAVVTCADPRVDQRLLSQIVEAYRQVVRQVVVVPFDPVIQPGTRISYEDLAEPTRRAYLALAVAVIDSLAAVEESLEKSLQQAQVHLAQLQQVRGGGTQ